MEQISHFFPRIPKLLRSFQCPSPLSAHFFPTPPLPQFRAQSPPAGKVRVTSLKMGRYCQFRRYLPVSSHSQGRCHHFRNTSASLQVRALAEKGKAGVMARIWVQYARKGGSAASATLRTSAKSATEGRLGGSAWKGGRRDVPPRGPGSRFGGERRYALPGNVP